MMGDVHTYVRMYVCMNISCHHAPVGLLPGGIVARWQCSAIAGWSCVSTGDCVHRFMPVDSVMSCW